MKALADHESTWEKGARCPTHCKSSASTAVRAADCPRPGKDPAYLNTRAAQHDAMGNGTLYVHHEAKAENVQIDRRKPGKLDFDLVACR